MDAEDRPRLVRYRSRVIPRVCAVGRTDLDELRARPREHVRDPEPAADLDELAARDDDLALPGERRQREEDRGRAVVHDDGVLGAGDLGDEPRRMAVPLAARA